MRDFVEHLKKKYAAKTPNDWPMAGDTVHFKDKLNGRHYCGEVLEWVRLGNRVEGDIYWRVKLIDGSVINCEYGEVLQVDRTDENRAKILREEG